MRKVPLLIIFLLAATSVFADRNRIGRIKSVTPYVAEPRLMAPTAEEVNLSGKDTIEFKWYPYGSYYSAAGGYYDFRIYKGYNMFKDALIFREKIPFNTYYIKVKTDLFLDGEVYTWAVRQVRYDLRKSDWSFNSFKAIKK